jgi:hypothetical protein
MIATVSVRKIYRQKTKKKRMETVNQSHTVMKFTRANISSSGKKVIEF